MADAITLEYARSRRTGLVGRIDCLHDLLIKQRWSVLFVGEGNFTFTVAFAALREYFRKTHPSTALLSGINPSPWGGITSTRYEPADKRHTTQFEDGVVAANPPAVLSDIKSACISNIRTHTSGKTTDSDCSNMIETVSGLQDTQTDKLKIYYGVDACKLPKWTTSCWYSRVVPVSLE